MDSLHARFASSPSVKSVRERKRGVLFRPIHSPSSSVVIEERRQERRSRSLRTRDSPRPLRERGRRGRISEPETGRSRHKNVHTAARCETLFRMPTNLRQSHAHTNNLPTRCLTENNGRRRTRTMVLTFIPSSLFDRARLRPQAACRPPAVVRCYISHHDGVSEASFTQTYV